jgi:hypothetical protein
MVVPTKKTASEILRASYAELLHLRGLVQRLESARRKTSQSKRRRVDAATVKRYPNSHPVGSALH